MKSMKDSNNVMEPSESHSDFITDPNRRFDSDLAAGEFAFKSKTDKSTFSKSVKIYECDKCKTKTFNRTSFIRHYKSHSAKNIIVFGDSQNINSSETNLETHTLDDKPIVCNICRKRFTCNSYLVNYYRIHTNEKSFVCDLCEKAFRLQSQLNSQTNEKPFVCDKCGKRFTRKSDLVVHEHTHTGERPYNCDMCEKRFNQRSNLVKHHRTHTGEKPYECGICQKRFSQRSNLNRHNRVHSNEKPFKCDLCQKTFKLKGYLVVHQRTHTAEKP